MSSLEIPNGLLVTFVVMLHCPSPLITTASDEFCAFGFQVICRLFDPVDKQRSLGPMTVLMLVLVPVLVLVLVPVLVLVLHRSA